MKMVEGGELGLGFLVNSEEREKEKLGGGRKGGHVLVMLKGSRVDLEFFYFFGFLALLFSKLFNTYKIK